MLYVYKSVEKHIFNHGDDNKYSDVWPREILTVIKYSLQMLLTYGRHKTP